MNYKNHIVIKVWYGLYKPGYD